MISLYRVTKQRVYNGNKKIVVPPAKHLHPLSMDSEAPSPGKVEKLF